ncbi:nucleotide exchange factor GrpE [Frankia sp. Cppng1_Ct_nod]|uniref:nucleotide exchange factor GrpE n=1 Tax=Frankia sp. Cppng1_Ct_nod TaxID=2897162 RepID=UPI0010417C38|nr:nucleotide exchange factor GrpE [Frankia sp. Cppng1_Ct_nod]
MTSTHGDEWLHSISTPDEPVIVRDKRRIDPKSGQVRVDAIRVDTVTTSGETTAPPTAAGSATPPAAPSPARDEELLEPLRLQVAERTADLQRLKAEFDNYRRRVERDRQATADQAAGKLLSTLLPTLDDIGRARDHGDLEGPFKAVAESLEATLETAGLERFGSRGDEFDPLVHDALMHTYSSDVTGPTCVDVYRSGYRHAGRVLRPAQVSVAEPASDADVDDAAVESVPGAGDGSSEPLD